MNETPKCTICGEPMPQGEEMFKFHGYSGPCPKPPTKDKKEEVDAARNDIAICLENAIVAIKSAYIAGVAESPEKAMEWLHNYLWGPGLLPTEEEIEAGADAFFDENHKGLAP